MSPVKQYYCENADGVHLHSTWDDRTLCGDAMEGYHGDERTDGAGDYLINPVRNTSKRTVTCEACVKIILLCRGVRVGEHK